MYSFFRTFLRTGNSKKPTVEITSKATDKGTEDTNEPKANNSKTVYINDSSNLDSIPFDVDDIVGEVPSDDVD